MKVSELVKRLLEFPQDLSVVVLDGFNGGGNPRDINLGPVVKKITARNASETADCEGRVGEKVIVIGYGCY